MSGQENIDSIEERIRRKEELADKAVVRAAATEEAIRQGVQARSARALVGELADLSGIPLDSEGEPDPQAVHRAISAALIAFPELARRSSVGRAPGGRRIPNG